MLTRRLVLWLYSIESECAWKPHVLHMQIAQTLPPLPNTRKHLKTEIVSAVCHCSSVAELCCDLTMFIHGKVVILILALTADGQGKFSFCDIIQYTVLFHTEYYGMWFKTQYTNNCIQLCTVWFGLFRSLVWHNSSQRNRNYNST